MNIFRLSDSPQESARLMCNQHVVKMILESCQMMSTAHRHLDGDENVDPSLYKKFNPKHPCTLWVMAHPENYKWLFQHYESLLAEYTLRYGKTHASSALRDKLKNPPKNIANVLIPVPQAMPDKYRREDPVEAYRAYYIGEKLRFAIWPVVPEIFKNS